MYVVSAESQASFSQKGFKIIACEKKRRLSALVLMYKETLKDNSAVRYMVLILSLFLLVTPMIGFQERCTTESLLCSLL